MKLIYRLFSAFDQQCVKSSSRIYQYPTPGRVIRNSKRAQGSEKPKIEGKVLTMRVL